MNPQFPLYIVSKGRWESRLTSKAFERMKVPYSIIVEEQEYSDYCKVIDKSKVLVLDKEYQRKYDTFGPHGTDGTGSGPARNFAWDHSIARNFSWHWVMDDNIKAFYRMNRNLKLIVEDGTIFRCMEDFVLRYENIAMAGPCYYMFAYRKKPATIQAPFYLNTRIYSCNLIRNDVPFRWRGRYNEDTDLSLRMLKAGWCTVEFMAFQQGKTTTLSMNGGNTDTIYKVGTLAKSQQLAAMHPDVATVNYEFGRWHHFVDYSRFRKMNRLIKKPGIDILSEVNDYGMKLISIKEERAP